MRQEDVDADYLFGSFLQFPAFRSAFTAARSLVNAGFRSAAGVEFAVIVPE